MHRLQNILQHVWFSSCCGSAVWLPPDYKYVLRTTHSANPARQGSISPTNPEIKTSFEQDVKVRLAACVEAALASVSRAGHKVWVT